MNKLLLQQLLDALEYHTAQTRPIEKTERAMTDLRSALAQPVPPVSTVVSEPMRLVAAAGVGALCGMVEGHSDKEDKQIAGWREWITKQNRTASQTLNVEEAISAVITEIEASQPVVDTAQPAPTPPFGTKRAAALALYSPPFSYEHGYIFDSAHHMVSDQDGIGGEVKKSIASRVRGWGRIGYLPDAAALQDEVGAVIAQALTEFWVREQSVKKGEQS